MNKDVHTVWDPKKESFNSYMFKIEEWRRWYSGLSRVEKIEMALDGTEEGSLNHNNIMIIELTKLKGQDYVNKKYKINKNEEVNESQMSYLQQTFDGF